MTKRGTIRLVQKSTWWSLLDQNQVRNFREKLLDWLHGDFEPAPAKPSWWFGSQIQGLSRCFLRTISEQEFLPWLHSLCRNQNPIDLSNQKGDNHAVRGAENQPVLPKTWQKFLLPFLVFSQLSRVAFCIFPPQGHQRTSRLLSSLWFLSSAVQTLGLTPKNPSRCLLSSLHFQPSPADFPPCSFKPPLNLSSSRPLLFLSAEALPELSGFSLFLSVLLSRHLVPLSTSFAGFFFRHPPRLPLAQLFSHPVRQSSPLQLPSVPFLIPPQTLLVSFSVFSFFLSAVN